MTIAYMTAILAVVVAFNDPPVPDNALESEFSAHGFNVRRVEHEDKITVPPERASAVWAFLLEYLVENQQRLRKIDPRFSSHYSVEEFVDRYFDTPDLRVLSRQSGVRHRKRVNLTNTEDRKSGRELMQIKLNNISAKERERAELKFEIKYPAEFRTQEDAHPAIGIVKPGHRDDFKERLAEVGIDAASLRPILAIHDLRRRIYILRDGRPFMSVSHDSVTSELMGAKCAFVEIEPELNEIAYTEAEPAARAEMVRLGDEITAILMTRFPDLKRDLTPKYNKAFAAFEEQISALRFRIRMNLSTTDLAGFALLIIACAAGAILFIRWTFRSARPSPCHAGVEHAFRTTAS